MLVQDALDAGNGRLTNSRFPWTIEHDVVLLVVKGDLTAHTAEGALRTEPRDAIFPPKGTALEYEAENALIFYAIHAAKGAADGADA